MAEPAKSFDDICREASTAFLKTVVVIDNEASLQADERLKEPAKRTAVRKRTATPDPGSHIERQATSDPSSNHALSGEIAEDDPEAHILKLNRVSRAFAERELTCGVYLPSDGDPDNLETLIGETVAAMHPTDACVLDWQLRVGDAQPAIEAINSVLINDEGGGGRLRLILIYTAEELKTASEQLLGALQDAGHEVELAESGSAPVITGKHFRIAFANKPTRGRSPDVDDAVIGWDGLPDKIIAEFTTLSRGLLRAFALQSVAAVRRDMHRILAQFDEELDPVYAGDRATKPDQADAAGMIIDLLNSELSHSVVHSGPAQDCLNQIGAVAWLEEGEARGCFRTDGGQLKAGDVSYDRIDPGTRKALLSDRPPAASWVNQNAARRITKTLFLTDEAETKASLKLAAFSTLARFSGRGTVDVGSVRLGFGTILRFEPSPAASADGSETKEKDPYSEVYVCIQPACESARIQDEGRPFLMVQLIPDANAFQLVTPNAGNFERWRLPQKSERHFRTVMFHASEGSDRVCGKQDEAENRSYFVDTEGRSWTWVADLRDLTAISIRDNALKPLVGVGLNGLEWLRLRAKA